MNVQLLQDQRKFIRCCCFICVSVILRHKNNVSLWARFFFKLCFWTKYKFFHTQKGIVEKFITIFDFPCIFVFSFCFFSFWCFSCLFLYEALLLIFEWHASFSWRFFSFFRGTLYYTWNNLSNITTRKMKFSFSCLHSQIYFCCHYRILKYNNLFLNFQSFVGKFHWHGFY